MQNIVSGAMKRITGRPAASGQSSPKLARPS
jgi:hypothetical protein